jgi:hypothetical protein
MTATLMFAEIVVIGTQVSIWIFLLIVSIFGYSFFQNINFRGQETVLAIVFLAVN